MEHTMKTKTTKKCAATKVAQKCAVKTVAKKCTKKTEKKEVTFTVHAERGKTVYLAGDFNGWDPEGKKMAYKARNGLYSATVKLAPGESKTVTFAVDACWLKAFNEQGEMVTPDGGITLYVGGHQPDAVSTRLTGTACERMELK